MAKLALAQCDVQDKKCDAAIATLRDLAGREGDLPVDAFSCSSVRRAPAAGKTTEARQAFERVTTEFATSPYAADAKKQRCSEGLTASVVRSLKSLFRTTVPP
jgi:hypothetical protein